MKLKSRGFLGILLGFLTMPIAQAASIALVAPSALSATAASASQINLRWQDNSSNEQGFIVQRSLSSSSGFIQIASLAAGATSYSNSSLSPATTYYYRVAAYKKTRGQVTYSAFSNLANATTFAVVTTTTTTLPSTTTTLAPTTTTTTTLPPPPPTTSWTFCSDGNQTCHFSGLKYVRYGTTGSYIIKPLTGDYDGIGCSALVFLRDPAPGVAKHCDYASDPVPRPNLRPAAYPIPADPTGPTVTVKPGDNLQAAINNAAAGTTVVFSPGTYNLSSSLLMKSGVSLYGVGATLVTPVSSAFLMIAAHDLKIEGFHLDGNGGGATEFSGAIHISDGTEGASHDIRITGNKIENYKTCNGVIIYSGSRLFIQQNIISDGYQGITYATDARTAPPLSETVVISDNLIERMSRMGIETGGSHSVNDAHIDRNYVSGAGMLGLSLVASAWTGSTAWGNKVENTQWAFELGTPNMTISENVVVGSKWALAISGIPGAVIENNTFLGVTITYGSDGVAYNGTEWIGTNTINGVPVTGNEGGYAWNAGKVYGPKPATYAPSAQP